MSLVYVFFADGFEEVEALTTVDLLRRAGEDVRMVSIMGRKTVTGSHNISVECDMIFEEIGKTADLITVNMMQPHLFPTGNPVNTLLECVTAADVCDSIVNGKVLMRDRKVLTLDEGKILAKAMEFTAAEYRKEEEKAS